MMPLRFLLFPLLGSGLLSNCAQAQPEATATPKRPATLPSSEEPLLELQYEPGSVLDAIQARIVLPFGTPVPADTSRVVVTLVVGTLGEVADAKIVRGLSPAVDEAVLNALHDDLSLRPVQRNGKYQNTPYTLTIQAPGAASPAQRREAATRWQRTAHRLPGEADSTFVQRVLPRSYAAADDQGLLTYAWRPSAFGKQLFFARLGGADNEYGTDLYVLDPYQSATYAVQVLPISTMGDRTNLAALFFADANHDGRQDLLALAVCALREQHKSDSGEMLDGHWNHYATGIWQYAAPDKTGRPQYRPDPTPRPYLDELATAADVRQTLARPPRPPGGPKRVAAAEVCVAENLSEKAVNPLISAVSCADMMLLRLHSFLLYPLLGSALLSRCAQGQAPAVPPVAPIVAVGQSLPWLDSLLTASPLLARHQVGFSLAYADSTRPFFGYHDSQYFVPASMMKVFKLLHRPAPAARFATQPALLLAWRHAVFPGHRRPYLSARRRA